jgi:hypothetical protein
VSIVQAMLAGYGPALVEVGDRRHDDHVSHLATTKNAPQRVSQ